MDWHIGCSGFHYRDWKGFFYPVELPQRKWFDYYSSVFDALELNVTFYRFPQLTFLQNWYNNSPAHFQFAVKAPRLITHYKQFSDCEQLLDDFYGTIEKGLQEKLGVVLFQLPPQFHYTKERLELLISSMRKNCTNAIEFRHSSWWTDAVYKALKKEKLVFCGISHPSLPGEAIITHPVVYYRFHGIPKLYYSAYKTAALKGIADSIGSKKGIKQAYIFFNNTATEAAIGNALWLRNYIAGL